MAGTETKRIIELTEASTVQSGDFIAVDSNARGTKKVPTSALATSAALTTETNARAGADEQMSERMDGIEEQTALIQNPTKTLSGALVSFTDGADMPMVACTAEIVPKQSGSGTPSPSNVRAISGWESVNVTDAVTNWLPLTTLKRDVYISSQNGEEVAYNGWSASEFIPIEVGTKYRLLQQVDSGTYSPVTGGALYWAAYDEDKAFIVGGIGDGMIAESNRAKFIRVSTSIYRFTKAVLCKDADVSKFVTVDDYVAPSTHTTDLGRTVYGGTLDVVSGVLTVDRAMVDLGTLNWTPISLDRWKAILPSGAKYPTAITEATTAISSTLEAVSLTTLNSSTSVIGIAFYNTFDGIFARNGSTTEPPTGQLCYELATPQTYQLTPTEVSTLLGDNNVWTDSGDVEITYRRDISIVLENLENALNGSNSLNTMMMSAPTENTAEEPTEDEAEDDMR